MYSGTPNSLNPKESGQHSYIHQKYYGDTYIDKIDQDPLMFVKQ